MTTHDRFLLECELCHRELSEDGHCRTESCPRFDDTPDVGDGLDDMTEEQVTLWLARSGHSPEDSRRALDRAKVRFNALVAEIEAYWSAVDAMINEGGPLPPAWEDP